MSLLEGVRPDLVKWAQSELPLPGDDAPRDWLEYGVKEGFYAASTMMIDESPAATIYFSKNDRGMLCINGAHSLRPDLDLFNWLEIAFRRIAKLHGCRTIEYITLRPGGVRKSLKLGYKICGVVLRRKIPRNDRIA